MSGVEVVGLVSGIIAAFAGAASFFQEHKKRKAEKAKDRRQELKKLQTAVSLAPPRIQDEYDLNFARIGPRFAAGDSIAREQLTGALQLIATLEQQLRTGSFGTRVRYSSLIRLAESSTEESIGALISQYQRLRAAAPITRTPSYLHNSTQPRYLMSPTPTYTLPTHVNTSTGKESVHKELAAPSTALDDLVSTILSAAPDNARHSVPTEVSTHIDTPVVREDVQEDSTTPTYSYQPIVGMPAPLPASLDDSASSTLPNTPDHAPISARTDLSTTSLAILTSTQNTTSSENLVLADLPASFSGSESLRDSESSVEFEVAIDSASTKQLICSADDPPLAYIPTSAERKMVESICSIATKAITTSTIARATHDYLVPGSGLAPSNTAFVRFLTSHLNNSANTLARGGKYLLQMTKNLTPAVLQASSEAQWLTALVEDCIATTNKHIAYGNRLLLSPSAMTDYTSSDKEYWLDQDFYAW